MRDPCPHEMTAIALWQIEQTPLTLLKSQPGNPRTHSKKQIRQIADSIDTFGFVGAILIDRQHRIIAGHGRAEAAKLLGMKTVPTIRIDGWSDAKIRAYVIADNRIAERSGWDRKLLAVEFNYLISVDWGFEITTTGFEPAEIDVILNEQLNPDDAEVVEQLSTLGSPETAVTRPGDLWQVGEHRLYCGDATEEESYQKLLGDARAGMVFMDPPYNVRIAGHVSGLGTVSHREFAMASGEMSSAEFEGSCWRPSRWRQNSRSTAASTTLVWIGGTSARSRPLDTPPTRNSRTSVSGRNQPAEWGRSIVPSTNWCSSSNPARPRMSTMSNSARTGVPGTNVWVLSRPQQFWEGSRRDARDAPDSQAGGPCRGRPSSTAPDGRRSSSTRLPEAAPPWSPLTEPADVATASSSTPAIATSSSGGISRITGEKPVLSASGRTFAEVETQRAPPAPWRPKTGPAAGS